MVNSRITKNVVFLVRAVSVWKHSNLARHCLCWDNQYGGSNKAVLMQGKKKIMQLNIYSFLTSTLNGDDVWVLGSGRFALGKKRHWIGSLVVPRTGLDPFYKRSYTSRGEPNHDSPIVRSISTTELFPTSLWLVPRQVCGLYRDKFVACTETSLWLVPRQVWGVYRDKFETCTETSLWLVSRHVCGL